MFAHRFDVTDVTERANLIFLIHAMLGGMSVEGIFS